jgi:hypothetical protein
VEYSVADPAVAAFIVLPIVLVATLVWGTSTAWRRAGATTAGAWRVALKVGAAAAVWMALTWSAARAGLLRDWDRDPPPFAFLVLGIVVLSAAIAFSGLGRRLAMFVPLWALVAVQGFRLPLELAMHEMFERGIMPREMSYSGRNFDIVTGVTAIIVAVLVASGRGGRRLVAAWNALGFVLLVNVVTVAMLATPRFQYFGSDRLNVWVTYPPFVWLPAVMVLAALAGQLVIFRALRLQRPAR